MSELNLFLSNRLGITVEIVYTLLKYNKIRSDGLGILQKNYRGASLMPEPVINTRPMLQILGMN